MESSISLRLNSCLDKFNTLIFSKSLIATSSSFQPSLSEWEDEHGRLRVWGANIGAELEEQLNLHYRMRDASHIQDETAQLLQDLHDQLEALQEALDHPPPHELATELETSEIQQIYEAVRDTITCLNQITVAIHHSAPHDLIHNIQEVDIKHHEASDRQHVMKKFPHASKIVIKRLGSSISRRRAILRYRVLPNVRYLPLMTPPIIDDASYPTSFFEDAVTRLGAIGPGSSRNSQRCSVCSCNLDIRTSRERAQHMADDLLPYVCIEADCPTAKRMYCTRREWKHHLEKEHGIAFEENQLTNCPLCRNTLAPAEAEMHIVQHLEELALVAISDGKCDDGEQGTGTKEVNPKKGKKRQLAEVEPEQGSHLTNRARPVPGASSFRRSTPGRLWLCCHCGDGPKVFDITGRCVQCAHRSCSGCTLVK